MSTERKPTSQAKIEASRRNGALGGRHRKPTDAEELTRHEAMSLGRSALSKCVRLWVDLVENRIPGSTNMDRLAASRELADRCGMPKRTESELVSDKPMTTLVIGVEGGLGWKPAVPALDAPADGAEHAN